MKKLMEKKVNMFGKEFSVFAIAVVSMMVLASAALIPYFGLITGHVTVTQGLLVDGLSIPASGNIVDSYNDFTSLQSPTYIKMHNLTNNANVQANGNIVTDCNTENTSDDCSDVTYKAVEYFDNAGADFSGYDSSICNSVTPIDASALNSIPSSGVVCVSAGTYTGNVIVPTGVTLVALNAPDSSGKITITGSVILNADSTLKGFVISPGTITGKYGVKIIASNTKVDSNIIRDITGNGAVSIDGIYVYSDDSSLKTNISITNNLIENIQNTGRGSNGVMIQGQLDGVNVTYNTIKDIVTTNLTNWWDYAMGIQDTPTSNWVGSPTNLVIEYNTLDNIQSVAEPGRGFGVDLASSSNYADASQVTLKYNNFLNIPNVLTNKDQSGNTLIAKDNYFDKLTYNVNGVAKDETGAIDAGWMTKTNFSIAPNGVDKFATLASFPKMLYPDTYTVNTTITA